MALKDITKFVKANNVSISVYGYQEGKEDQEGFIYPLKVTKEMNERHVNLLLITDDDTNHYCFIKNFVRLVGPQFCKGKDKTYFYRFCLHGFSNHYTFKDKAQHRRTVIEVEEKLKKHEARCFAFAAQRSEFPDDPILKFENIQKQIEAPFTKEQYEYAEDVWKTLKFNTMKDYHNHYLITGILLLTGVFENFRKMSLETYGLAPIQYYCIPGLSWDTMFKYTGVELVLIIYPDMHQMVEESMRGSISNIFHPIESSQHEYVERERRA